MSLPGAVMSSAAQQAVVAMNPLDAIMATINTNPYFIGLMMLSLNLGGRFLSLEISKDQEKFLSQPYVRRFFLFAVLFVATRNIVIAAGTTVIVILLLGYLFNENSSLCLWKQCINPLPESFEDSEKKEGFTGKGLTPDEQNMLRRLLDKQNAASSEDQTGEEGKRDQKVSKDFESRSQLLSSYARNMNALSSLRAGGGA